MRKFYLTILALTAAMAFSVGSAAQEIPVPEGYELVDSLVYRLADAVDTSLVGRNIYNAMPSRHKGDKADVNIKESGLITSSMNAYIKANSSREMSGYRVRIFFDNHRTARTESEATLKKFVGIYHDVPAYRTYANPYFKVTVGDFRTKSEAVAMLERIREDFPSAFVIKETISFPVVDKDNAYIVDTVKVLRPVAAGL